MVVLGIDSSGLTASAALVTEDRMLSEFTVNNKQTHSQTLLPMIERVVAMAGIEPEQIDAIAVAAGPGSFTGLRIGSSTAKGLALAWEKKIVPVPTLEGLAYRMAPFAGLVCPLMDARRNQVYTGIYRMGEKAPEVVWEQRAVDISEVVQELNAKGEPVLLMGDGAEAFAEVLREALCVPFRFAPPFMNRQSAAAVASLGLVYYKSGRAQEARDYRPFYLRKSQAEREREERLLAQEKGAADEQS